MWPTDHGPVETLLLPKGAPEVQVPIVARTIVDAMVSGDPLRLRHFPLPAGLARITDTNALLRPSAHTAADGCSRLLGRARLRDSIHAANSASAASSERRLAAARTLDGTQSGKGTSLVT